MKSVVVVTGASRGLGLELCKQFHVAGHYVIATVRNKSDTEKVSQYASKVMFLDIKDETSIEEFANSRELPQEVALFINNAAIKGDMNCTTHNLSFSNLMNVLQTNTVGSLCLSSKVLQYKKIKKMVTISSKVSSISDNDSAGMVAYRVSKVALNMGAKCLKIEHKKTKHMLICPGWTKTDMGGSNARHELSDMVRKIIAVINNETNLTRNFELLDFNGNAVGW